MSRLKCKNCGAVFHIDPETLGFVGAPWTLQTSWCPACGKSSWFNVYSSVKDPVTYPPQEKKPEEQPEQHLPKKTGEEAYRRI